jgi:cbb3-type cytochrome oxidase subunit 3
MLNKVSIALVLACSTRYNFDMHNIFNLIFPIMANAATPPIPRSVKIFLGNIITEILNPLIALMFAVALMYFFYGIAAYIWNPDNEEAREKGRRGMLWGIIGMFIMVSVFGIMWFIINSIGADSSLMDNV